MNIIGLRGPPSAMVIPAESVACMGQSLGLIDCKTITVVINLILKVDKGALKALRGQGRGEQA